MLKKRWVIRVFLLLGIVACLPLAFLAGCQSSLIYFPRPYAELTVAKWQSNTSGKFVDVKTSQGQQRAFLQGNLKNPQHLWVVCGGNGTVALDWSDWMAQNGPARDAYLLVDLPGYGQSHGKATPGRIRETFRKAVPAAMQELGWSTDKDTSRLRFFGHSLGSAACLMAATDFHIQRGVLLAPFSSTMAMARRITGMPVGFLVWHRMDNDARLADLEKQGARKVLIFHGTADEVIPVEMSREMAARHPHLVKFIEVPGGRHNTIQETEAAALSQAMREVD